MLYYIYGIILFVYVRIPVDMVNVSDNFIDFVFTVHEMIFLWSNIILFVSITDSGFDTKGMTKEEMFEIVVSVNQTCSSYLTEF